MHRRQKYIKDETVIMDKKLHPGWLARLGEKVEVHFFLTDSDDIEGTENDVGRGMNFFVVVSFSTDDVVRAGDVAVDVKVDEDNADAKVGTIELVTDGAKEVDCDVDFITACFVFTIDETSFIDVRCSIVDCLFECKLDCVGTDTSVENVT